MNYIMSKIHGFFADEKGAETAEWAIIVGLLIIMATAIYAPSGNGSVGAAITNVVGKISAAING